MFKNKLKNYLFDKAIAKFLSCSSVQYLTKIIETNSIPEKISGDSGMAHFAEINQDLPPYSMLQHIGRVATLKLVPRNCLRYLQTTLIMGEGGLVSEFM